MNGLDHRLRAVAQWIVPIVVILGWELASRIGWLSSRILPEPIAVGRAAWELLKSGLE